MHLIIALLAIASGAVVVLTRKGTRNHRWFGRAYLGLMIALNISALFIYELFGGFGLFHWMAVFSLATVLMGYYSVRSKRPGWKAGHAYFMSGSYVGVLAALAAEVLTRTPFLPFFGAVGVASLLVFIVGLYLMFRFIPRLL